MRPILAVALVCFWVAAVHAGWQEVTITDDYYGAQCVHAADFDGDGDVDLLGAALYGDEIDWWENTDSNGLAWTLHTVDAEVSHPTSVYAIDVDDDGDMDILGTSYYDDTITWWENLDGTGLSWGEHTVGSEFSNPWCVHAADVDGDGDVDVLGAAFYGDAISWWENLDGTGQSWTEHSIGTQFNGALSVYTADVDGDGDLDVIGGAAYEADITWWENLDGVGQSWTEHSVNGLFGNPWDVYAADMDGDGDVDVLGCDTYEGDIVWCENRDGEGLLWSGHNVSNTSNDVHGIQAADVDGDGDMDVLGAAGELGWWENLDGTGQYWIEHTIDSTYRYKTVYSTDVDGDGEVDVLGTAEFDNAIILNLQEGPHEQEPVVVLISPVTPTVVPQGGSFVYDFRMRVNYQQPFNGYLWTMIGLPNDQYYGPVFSTPIQFSPGMQVSIPGIQQRVPGVTPVGYYDWIVNAGPTPFMPIGTDSFPVRVIAGSAADSITTD